jgi:hypothetical protein
MAQRRWFKGPAALALDAWYSDSDTSLGDAQTLLESRQSFHEIVEHLDRWDAQLFPHPENGYVQGPDFERVARRGYLKAIELAQRHSPQVPIKTFWMTGVGNSRFEMQITDEQDRVSVTVVVPEVDEGSDKPGSPEAWLVTINEDDKVVITKTSGEGYREEESTIADE